MLKIGFSPIYHLVLPEGHRVPSGKHQLLYDQLCYEGIVSDENFFEPKLVEIPTILRTHDVEYWEKINTFSLSEKEIKEIGMPINEYFVKRTRTIVNGTLEAALMAKKHGAAMNAAGGSHHAFTYKGAGFCLLNDQAIASNYLLDNDLAKKILIIDLDVHQGDGTAQIFQKEEKVFTFSMHGQNNYPNRKEKSDLDIGLPDACDDAFFLKTLENTLPRLIEEVEPDFVFYQAGVDILESDKLGRLSVSQRGCYERDLFVFKTCHQYRLPIVGNLGGGYSEKIADIINAHANTFRAVLEVYF
jgi:acetoin utilization deacetylase AcuC-like enzyme